MTTLSDLSREFGDRVDRTDFAILAAHAVGKPKEYVFREPGHVLSGTEETALRESLRRRSSREPVAYIVGEKEFFGLPFEVTRDTLVPRPETEHLVEEALSLLSGTDSDTTVIDIGTGSGAIIVPIAKTIGTTVAKTIDEPKKISFFATDFSTGALEVARRNAKRHDVGHRIVFLEGNLLDPVPEDAFDSDRIIFLANLPYLSEEIYSSADRDVRDYEPRSALVAQDDGLALYLRLLDDIARRKHDSWPDMRINGLFEIGPEQRDRISSEFERRFPNDEHSIIDDLSGRPRIFRFRISPER
ncbi:MAG: peptide chain release factor N(5)-glutamine methyltransferase [Candidatus Moranbacteria bacterium]|nr:peptide chain release factor N(5)-glutamine methyltransferase [Candidatus Moranbacteria bacterium]